MDIETRNKQIDQYLNDAEADFDRIMEAGEQKRRRKIVVRAAILCPAFAACIALLLWLVPMHPKADRQLTPIQIAEGIQQMMLLDIGDIESIVATPTDSYAILTARLKDGSSCAYVLRVDDEEGTTTLLAYNKNE